MKKPDLSRLSALALFAALSLIVSLATADAIAAHGMNALARIQGSQHVA